MGAVMESAIELEQGTNAALQQTLDYWQQLRGQRRMPARKDLDRHRGTDLAVLRAAPSSGHGPYR